MPEGHAAPQLLLAPNRLEIRIPIRHLDDIVKARRSGRLLARQLEFSGSRVALVLTAISELARNLLMHAGGGEIVLTRSREEGREGVVVLARDTGPGIADVNSVLDSPNPNPCLGGRGLSCLNACMDRFQISSRPGSGTQVECEVFSGRTS
ncbi:MAG: ATP-binding protein [Xanthomonadales bacterium]|nr:ATP-binding protein [Xanthomonadales bacterium]